MNKHNQEVDSEYALFGVPTIVFNKSLKDEIIIRFPTSLVSQSCSTVASEQCFACLKSAGEAIMNDVCVKTLV